MAKLWYEVWDRPGDATYARKIADLPAISGGATIGYSGVGKGSMVLPSNYSRLDEILYTDADTSANGVWSTVKLFSEGTAAPIYEWLPTERVPPQKKDDPGTQITGEGIESIIGFAKVEPWDWDGSVSFQSTFPDWVYGGRNLLGNPGFEESPCRPEVNTITRDPTVSGGTFTLSDGVNTTSALAWNASAFTIETELESDIVAIDDVVVTGVGSEADPWVIEFVSPCEFPGGLTANFASLTPAPGDTELARTQFGALQPDPWTKSQVVSSGTPRIFGEYDSFRVTTAQARTGTFSLLIDPDTIGRRYAGAQQIVSVQPGGRYQASVWVFTASASQIFRLVIRGIDEDLMLDINGAPALVQVTPTANTWTQLSIPDVVIEDDTQIIFRIANINVSGNPAIFYVDDGAFNEGLVPATVGQMFSDLYDDATADHAPGRRVWYNGTSFYLTLDFDGTLDSDANAWDSVQSLTFRPRMSYLQVLDEFVKLGYEWRVVADSVAGTYLLQIYNPGDLGATVAAGIQGGSTDIRRNARYFVPDSSTLMVQGQGHLSARASDAGLLAAFGRLEGVALDTNITSTVDALLAAANGVTANIAGAEGLVYTFYPQANMFEPLVAYRPGDTISIEDPPVISGTRRIAQIEVAINGEYTVYFSAVRLVGQTAVNEAVDFLLRKFQQADEVFDPGDAQIFGGGGMMTVAVAASNASASSQSKADFICDGTDDQVLINEAIQICADTQGGTVWLSEGAFNIDGLIDVSGQAIDLRGLGYDTILIFSQDFDPLINLGPQSRLLDMTVRGIIS